MTNRLHDRMLAEAGTTRDLGDGELLDRYASGADDLAFATLVERHGPMVLRACQAILRDRHAAEDAFQATFLVLARRGRSLWVRDSVAPWLHEVACRVARGVRTAEGRRKALDRRSPTIKTVAYHETYDDDLGLHEAIDRLPDRLKGAVVLCYLQGLTHEQAADRLACPVGTVRSRLSRGRDRLRSALSGKGNDPNPLPRIHLTPIPAALLAASARSATGRMSFGLVDLIHLFFWKGVVASMNGKSISIAAMVLLTAGAAAVMGGGGPQQPNPPETSPPAQVAALKEDVRRLNDRLNALEAKLAGPSPKADATARDPVRQARASETPTRKIRARFSALVETVHVKPGDLVKAGDPLVVLHGSDLADAANDARVKFVQWDNDRKYLIAREPLAREKRITDLVWVQTQNEEKKSRVQYLSALDKLGIYGVQHAQILEILADLQDDDPKKPRKADATRGLVRLTITAPFDAKVVECPVEAGDWAEPKDLLMVLVAQDSPAAEPAPGPR